MNETDKKRESYLTLFFWMCSGADINLLRKLPSEKQKYMLLGATIFITAIIAAISGIYAFSAVFENMFLGVSFGVIWSILILIFDRFVISSVSKANTLLKTLINILPSLLISVLLSIVISTPLSLKLFENQIQLEHRKQIEDLVYSVKSKNGEQINNISNEIETLNFEIEGSRKNYENLRTSFISEIEGLNGSEIGYGSAAYFKRELLEKAQEDYYSTRKTNDSLIANLNERLLILSKEMNITVQLLSAKMTFTEMMQVFSLLRTKQNTINISYIFFSILTLILFSAPILMQVLIREGPYISYVKLEDKLKLRKYTIGENINETTNKIEQEEIERIKENLNDTNRTQLESLISELGDKQQKKNVNPDFKIYFNSMLDSFSNEAEKYEKKSKDFFRLGMIFSIMGIIIGFALLAFWLNYFSIKKFEYYQIFELISGTFIILLIEFLGAWLLKQHKILSEKSSYLLKMKTNIDRYMLIYLAIKDFSGDKEKYLIQLISTIDKDIIFPPELSNLRDLSFAQEAFSSISSLTKTIENLAKIK